MTLKLASADFAFPLLDHDRVLQLIGMLGMNGVDIGLFEGRSHLWASREFEQLDKNAKQLRSKIDDHGLKAADLFLQLDPDFVPFAINHPEKVRRDHAREVFSKTLDYASVLGCDHVTALPGVLFHEKENPGDSLQRAYDELEWRVRQADSMGITFGTEAHVGSLAATPAEAMQLIQAVPGLTLTLDYTHFTRAGIPDEAIEPLIANASHFHVRGACRGRLQTSFNQNTIDYARVLRAMKSAAYDGWLGIEYVWIDWERCNECDNLSETILYRNFLLAEHKCRIAP